MPNALVEFYRKNNPYDARSDDEITQAYVERFGLDRVSKYDGVADDWKRIDLEVRKGTAPSLPGELKRAVSAGIDRAQGKLYDTVALAGDIIGSETLTRLGEEGYKRNLEEAAQNPPTIQGVKEIEGVGDAARYVTQLVGGQAPQLAMTAAGGLAGLATGGLPGAAVGAGLAGFSQMQNRGELRATPGVDPGSVVPTALGVGAIGSALEALPVFRAINKLFPRVFGDAASEVATAYLPRVLREVPTEALLEGGTEIAQELTTMAGELYANRNNPNFTLTPETINRRLLESGVAGAILGGGMGAVTAIPGPRQEPQEIPAPVDALAPSTVTPETPAELIPAAPAATPVPADRSAGAPLKLEGGGGDDDDVNARGLRARQAVSPVLVEEGDPELAAALERAKVTRAAAQTDPNPTEAQKEAGNYKKGVVRIQGLEIAIENPEGSVRRGTDADGTPWEVVMPATYGYLKRTEGSDGDAVDVYIGPNPKLPTVYVIDQINAETGEFDETKTMIGFPSKEAAIATYDAAFSDGKGPERREAIHEVNLQAFRSWLEKGDTSKPFILPKAAKEQERKAQLEADKAQREAEKQAQAAVDEQRKAEESERKRQQKIIDARNRALERDQRILDNVIERERTKIIARQEAEKAVEEALNESQPEATPNPQQISNELVVPEAKGEGRVGFNLESVDWDGTTLTRESTRHGTASKSDQSTVKDSLTAQERTREPAFFTVTETEYSPALGERLTSDAEGAGTKSNTRRLAFFENQETGEVVGYPIWKTRGKERGVAYRVAGTTLDKFMAAGNIPIASFRTTEPVSATDKGNVIRYEDFKAFEREVINPAFDRLKATSNTVLASEARMQAQGFDSDGNVVEFAPSADLDEDPTIVLQSALLEEVGGPNGLKDISYEDLRDVLSDVAKSEPQAYIAILRDLLKDPVHREALYALHGDQSSQEGLLKEILTGKLYDKIQEVFNSGARKEIVGASTEGVGDTLFSRPEGGRQRPDNGAVKARFNQLVETARELGITVEIVKAVGKEVGSFTGKERKVTLALFDANNPSVDNLRLLLHEIAHDFSRDLPDDLRTAIHSAIEAYSDERLGIATTTDPRISRSNQAGLGQAELNEERLAEHLAIRGLDRPTSNSLAARIVRAIKELYHRIALAVQKVLGRQPSRELALAYVRNRFDALTSGDRQGLFRFLIPPIETQAYPETLFSRPGGLNRIGDRLDPRVIVETRVAALNEKVDLEKQIETELTRVPAAVTAAKDAGIPVIDWWRKVIRADDPKVLIEAERQRVDPVTGLVIGPDVTVRIGSFQAEQNRQIAARDALATINKEYARVQERIADLAEEVRKWEAKRKVAADEHQRLSTMPILPMSPEDTAKFKAKLDRLEKNAKRYAQEVDKADARMMAAQQVVGIYLKKVNELKGPLGAHEAFHFGHGAQLWVPRSTAATGPGNGFEFLTIQLDSAGKLTKRSEIEAAAEKMAEWLDVPGRPQDGVYWQVKAMLEEILKHRISTDVRQFDATVTGLAVASISEQAKALGTPQWRTVAQLVNRFVEQSKFLRSTLEPMALKVNRAKHDAANTIGVNQEFYRINFFKRAVNFLESRRDIVEAHPRSFKQQMDVAFGLMRQMFMSEPSLAKVIGSREHAFMGALRKHVEAEWEVSQFIQKHTVNAGNVFVRDERIGLDRAHIQVGIVTLPRNISETFDSVFNAMRHWAGASDAFKTAAAVYDQMGPDELRASIAHLFVDPKGEIQKNFFRALVEETGTFSPFPAPALEDGTQPEANPAFARDAYTMSGGDPVTFFELMYDLHGGTGDRGTYIQEGLMVFARYFAEMRRLREQIDPDGMGMPKDFKTMIPGLMIAARDVEHWPAIWHEPMSFDTERLHRVTERVAAQVAFGNQNERLVTAYENGVREYNRDVAKLARAQEWVNQNEPSKDASVRRAALAKAVGGTAELKRLEKLTKLSGIVDGGGSIRSQLVTYFSGKNSSLRPMKFLQNLTSLFSGLMVNQPGSTLSQLAETFTPFLKLGVNEQSIRMTARNIAGVAKEVGGGLINSFGEVLKRQDRWYQRAQSLGVTDYDAARKLKDIIHEPGFENESSASTAVRKIRSVLTTPIGGGQFTGFRLLAPFHQVNVAMHITSTINFWKLVDDLVAQGVEWAKKNPAEFTSKLADEPVGKWAERLGQGDAFKRIFQRALDEWGLDYYSLVKEGMRNQSAGKELLSDLTLSRLQGMWIKESVTESNIATMSSAAFNNSVLRFMLPLLGWGWRRSRQVTSLRFDETDRASLTALGRGLLGLAVLGAGGLAVSALVDLYNEELLQKRRNLRRLSPDQGAGNLTLALLEHSARVGTFGILGDLANEMVNVGTGSGANRGISMDNRVVFVNSVLGMVRAISAFSNQDFEADYMNVVRPALFSMGGNGALQYLQMASTVFDLDNVESRAVRRTNVGNWLRVMGRELGMEVNTDQRGYSSPTPITPYITRMQLAALADDRDGFTKARMEAINKAREEGKADASEYVARTYGGRHPLKTVFRTPISSMQYRQLLNAMPENGRMDVMEAVNLFNRYGALMGVMPYDGREARARTAGSADSIIREARDRALGF